MIENIISLQQNNFKNIGVFSLTSVRKFDKQLATLLTIGYF